MRVRGFAGLPDGSEWVVDEVAIGAAGEAASAGDEVTSGAGEVAIGGAGEVATGAAAVHPSADDGLDWDAYEAAGGRLARRMLAAGAADLLRDAEAMAAR